MKPMLRNNKPFVPNPLFWGFHNNALCSVYTLCVNPPFRLATDWIRCGIWTTNINEWIHEIPFMHYSSTMFCYFVPLNISFNLNENNITMNKHVHPMWGYINSLLICIYSPFQICPICAALPGGDPNHVTDDFAAHLTLEHRAPRDLISFYLNLMCICPSICSVYSLRKNYFTVYIHWFCSCIMTEACVFKLLQR